MKIVGIDLAGSERRSTGFCVMNEKLEVQVFIVHTDEEIVEKVEMEAPDIIAIDAPLSLPKGRKSLKLKSKIHFRECDRELWKFGIKFFPITLGPMRKLTERGMKLKELFEKKGYKVIEVYPGGAQDILKLPRKQNGIEKLRSGLERMGVRGLMGTMGGDELDAVTCALVGKLYLEGNYTALGNLNEGQIIVPKLF